MNYSGLNIDLWRNQSDYNRPKWGIYRLKNESLKDEVFSFADFCVAEEDESLCMEDGAIYIDSFPPSPPTNFIASKITSNSVTLSWNESSDNYFVDSYTIFQDGDSIWNGDKTTLEINDLSDLSTYEFSILANDISGNKSEDNPNLIVTTLAETNLPGLPENPFPRNGSFISNDTILLSWKNGELTDSSKVYIEFEGERSLLGITNDEFLELKGLKGGKYYWQLEQYNQS